MNEPRLLPPDQAAAYLGLGSRWAIYRLIAAGQLPVVKLAGKLRIDRQDLDALITRLKAGPTTSSPPPTGRRVGGVPDRLRPLVRPTRQPPGSAGARADRLEPSVATAVNVFSGGAS